MTPIDDRILTSLKTIATDEEVTAFLAVLEQIRLGHGEAWMFPFFASIVSLLDRRAADQPVTSSDKEPS